MTTQQGALSIDSRIQIQILEDKSTFADLAKDVRMGLLGQPKQLPPKYFYDEHGSELFDKICDTKEYYPTRIEAALLAQFATEIISLTCPEQIVELGSGASRKTTHLLTACNELGNYPEYQPMDICGDMLLQAGTRLLQRYEWLEINGVVGDYSTSLSELPEKIGPRLFVFLGGTIGNFNELESQEFLRTLHSVMDHEDWFLLGVDRVKDKEVLHAAYNDVHGYTAAFNRNVLSVINRELDGQFNLGTFEHHAWFNESQSQIEMHLRSNQAQSVRIEDIGLEVDFSPDETILTEISRKFTFESLSQLLIRSNFKLAHHYEPENGYFSLVLAHPARSNTS